MDQITKENILSAIEEIDRVGIRAGRHSSTYDLLFNGKLYPPKLVISIANKYAIGTELDPTTFEGGLGTKCFQILEKFGFEIKAKKDPILELIKNYKSYIAKTKMKDELYKWELIKKFKGRPDTNAPDFANEYKEIKFGNLLYQLASAVGNHICREKPEEFRKLFVYLFDESIPLDTRVNYFNVESLALYRSLGETLGHHQDERSISTYLTVHNPEKYTFYKSTFYKEFCKLMGVEPAGKNEKYGHYLALINQFIESYIVPDDELTNTVKNFIPEYYDGNNNLLLAQDILYCMLNKSEEEPNYWVFQGNPKVFDIESALKTEILNDWTVSAHKDKIKIGDKVILWFVGGIAGCYALAEVTSEPHLKENTNDDHLWKTEDKNDLKAGIKITHNLLENPILKEDIADFEELKQLKVGSQGTNFSSNQIEYEAILDLLDSKNEGLYQMVKNSLDTRKFNEFTDVLRQFITKHQLDERDERLSFNVRKNKNRLVFIIGNRYALNIEGKGNKTKLSFISKEKLSNNSGAFTGKKGENEAYWNIVESYSTFNHELQEGLLIELNREYKSPFRKYTNQDFINDVFQKTTKMNNKADNKSSTMNTILYGPPGTGKTFRLKSEYFPRYTTKETSLSPEQHFENIVSECSWWQVIAVALIQLGKSKVSAIAEHPWVVQKTKISNSNTVRPTLWGQLQSHTVETCEFVNVKSKQQPFIFNKTEDSLWEIINEEEVKEQAPEIYDLIDSVENFKPSSDKEIQRYVFTTFHQSYSYEDFIEGIKPIMIEGEEDGNVAYRIEDGIFKQLCKKAEMDPDNPYAIFIDEINRGNVSAIFGELITLIEQDKRKGAANAMSALLPYSKKQFSVPQNVDIYGTMNTADRSVEALDTALRRRFSFEEMLPDPALLKDKGEMGSGKVGEIDLEILLVTINERIEALVDRDHTIGHAFFMDVDSLDSLRTAFANKVIPLLQEYFYGDYAKMEMVIGPDFFNIKDTSKIKFAVRPEDFESTGKTYQIKILNDKISMTDEMLVNAFNKLIKGVI